MEYVAEVSDIYYTFVLELLFTHGGSYTCHLPMAGIFMPVNAPTAVSGVVQRERRSRSFYRE